MRRSCAEPAADAARALACLDLTLLEEGATPREVDALCDRARTPHGPVAAVCVFPASVARARSRLAGSGIRVATVVNFPGGDLPIGSIRTTAAEALAAGAQEIDMVIPWQALHAGDEGPVRETIRTIRQTARDAVLKTILETGALDRPELIARAATIAIAEGADFLKTSTGRAEVNATPEAVEILLEAAKAAPRTVGVKPAGGIRTADDAARLLALADRIMGPDWARPETFRIGASSLISSLLAVLDGEAATLPGGGY